MREHVILDWSIANFVTVTLMWIVGLLLLAVVARLLLSGGSARTASQAPSQAESEPELPMAS